MYSMTTSLIRIPCISPRPFSATIRNVFRCGSYFVVECYGSAQGGWRCSVGQSVYGPPKNVRVVLVIPVFFPQVLFMFLYVGSYPTFKSLCAGSHVFGHLMLFLCVILHTMWLGKSLQLLCILPFGMLCLSAISMMFVK